MDGPRLAQSLCSRHPAAACRRVQGYGTIVFSTPEEAAGAIEQFNGTDLEGRTLSVKLDQYA